MTAYPNIIRNASSERGAWINWNIPYCLDFILLTEFVHQTRDMDRPERATGNKAKL
jgi:hypothetical protein